MVLPPEAKATNTSGQPASTRAALAALRRGYVPIPIRSRSKTPMVVQWTRTQWAGGDDDGIENATAEFNRLAASGGGNVGLLLGEPSGGLVDVDLDHPGTNRLKRHFLPPTTMRSGRPGNPQSHWWYIADPGTVPGNRRHKMPDGKISVELRAGGSQTVIPPSTHPSGEKYRWEGQPWGGKTGPTRINGRKLSAQVALLGLGTVLLDQWPEEGSRHDAYLALAGGLLRYGEGIHPFWEKQLPVLISALAVATMDDDGPDKRVSEVMGTTLARLQAGTSAVGMPRLAEFIGEEHVKQTRRLIDEVESAGWLSRPEHAPPSSTATIDMGGDVTSDAGDLSEQIAAKESELAALAPEERDPLGERVGSWQAVDLEPYLSGQVHPPEPSVLPRSDGPSLFYAGRVNMLYGSSESGKSWIALHACLEEMRKGGRVMYLDFEDEPVNTLDRLMRLGGSYDDIQRQFTYVRPEDPLAPMQRNRWGQFTATDIGRLNLELFQAAQAKVDPTLIVADGMSVLYGLHGLDTNATSDTEVITGWLKRLTHDEASGSRPTVIVIDHTGKSPEKGSLPIGSQHKVSMVQGTLLQVWPKSQPMPDALGEVELIVLKDRPGQVRRISSRSGVKAQTAAIVSIDSRPVHEGKTIITINPPVAPSTDNLDLRTDRTAEKRTREAEAAHLRKTTMDAEDRSMVVLVYRNDADLELTMAEIVDRAPSDWSKEHTRSLVRRMYAPDDDRPKVLHHNGKRGMGSRYSLITSDVDSDADTEPGGTEP